MSEMVERVARALCKAADDDWDWSVFYIVDAKDTAETGRELYREMARAAIEAMREPTKEMMRAMFEAMFEEKFDGTTAPMMGAGFEAAIDAALKD